MGKNDENTDKIIINTKMEVTPPLTTTDSITRLLRSSIIDDLMAQLKSLKKTVEELEERANRNEQYSRRYKPLFSGFEE